MNKLVYLGLSILDLSKTVMYEIWYAYLKRKYGENVKFCHMDKDNFIIYVKTDDTYKDIAENVEKRIDVSNQEIDRPSPKGKNRKVIGLMKDELGGKMMKEFVGLRAKIHSYLKDKNDDEYKKEKGTKKWFIKRKPEFRDYNNCLIASQIENLEKRITDVDRLHKEFIKNKRILKTQQRFKNKRHNTFTEKIKKGALSSNDDKIIQSINLIGTYAYGTSKDLICKKERNKRLIIIKAIPECLTLSQLNT